MSDNDKIIESLNKLKIELRTQREARMREEGKLSQLLTSLKNEIGTDNVEEAKDMAEKLLDKMENDKKEIDGDLKKLREHYGF
jgi:3-oxoacyl-[acyl-carrier-protein] synthase III